MPDFVCVCGKSFASSDNLKHHQRYRCRPDDQGNDDTCKICGRIFKSFAGVRQHMRRSHPEQYNDELQNEDRRVLRTWSAFENLQLARAEIAYTGYNVNQHLHTLFPDRSFDSIKSHRRTNEYKNLRDRIKLELEEALDEDTEVDEALSNVLTPDVPILDSGAPPEIPVAAEVYEIGPSDRETSRSDSLGAIGLRDIENVSVVEQEMSPPPPSPPHTPSPPPTQLEAAAPDTDVVKSYIEHLLTLVALDHDYRQNVDIVLDETISIAERREAITFLWRNIGVRGGFGMDRVPTNNLRSRPTFDNRRKRYAYVQRLYKTDKSRLAEGIITDTIYDNAAPTFSAEDASAAYNIILGTPSQPDDEYISDYVHHDVVIYSPILIDELGKFLHARQSNAKGPDGITPGNLKMIQIEKLALLFNLVLFSSLIPGDWRCNRTVLIPKAGCDNGDVNTWRPLTISSIGLRIFNKILAARFSNLPLQTEQRGFRSIDGTLANTIALQKIIKDCRASSKPFSITTLDLRKAFDTVSHCSLLRALDRFGIENKIKNLISDNYHNCTTTINVGGVSTDSILINRGVKQGDPLSPILFNMVLDEAICHLKNNETGLTLDDTRYTCLAYADDLLLFASNKREMQWAVRLLERNLKRRGMVLNPAKCSNITCNLLPSKSKLYLATRGSIVVEGGLIRQLSVEDQFKYLGYNYGFMGARESSVGDLPVQLQRIVSAPLKPQQKLSIIKQYLIPRYIYLLQNPSITLRTLSSADRLIRLAVKKALHLPQQTSNAALYAPPKQGGLGLISFRCRIPGILLTRMESLAAGNLNDELLASCLRSEFVTELKNKLGLWCRTSGITSAQVISYWASRLEASASGGGLWQVGAAGCGGNWVDWPPHYWTGEEYVRSLQLRLNLLPTRGGLHNRSGDTACRAGCARRETACHVLQACPSTHFERIRRHDHVVNRLASFARNKNISVEIEPRFRDGRGVLHKPDLLLRRGDAVLIADVAVHWEGPDVLSVSAGHKVARYSEPSLLDVISAKYPDCTVAVAPFVLGARGGWCSANRTLVDFVGVTRKQIDLLIFSVLKGGWLIHSSFSARVWADV